RRSTSAGLFRADTGQKLPGSSGLHVYLSVQDGADVERFLRSPISTHGAAPILRPFTLEISPRAARVSTCMTKNHTCPAPERRATLHLAIEGMQTRPSGPSYLQKRQRPRAMLRKLYPPERLAPARHPDPPP